jgi:hypothetical protein
MATHLAPDCAASLETLETHAGSPGRGLRPAPSAGDGCGATLPPSWPTIQGGRRRDQPQARSALSQPSPCAAAASRSSASARSRATCAPAGRWGERPVRAPAGCAKLASMSPPPRRPA